MAFFWWFPGSSPDLPHSIVYSLFPLLSLVKPDPREQGLGLVPLASHTTIRMEMQEGLEYLWEILDQCDDELDVGEAEEELEPCGDTDCSHNHGD